MVKARKRKNGAVASKYRSQKVVLETGERFDSKKEERRYKELIELVEVGLITDLKRQVTFELLPSQKLQNPYVEKGKTVKTWRGIKYIADFTYYDYEGNFIVEDVKGMRTDVYLIKRKLMLNKFGCQIREV